MNATTPELLTVLYKREDQYKDAMAKAALAAEKLGHPELRDIIRGIAKTYGMVRLTPRPEELWTPENVTKDVLSILRRYPDQIFRPGDLRTELEPVPTLSVWQDAIRILMDHPNVNCMGSGDTRRYRWTSAKVVPQERTAS
jgi:hypothetical protein